MRFLTNRRPDFRRRGRAPRPRPAGRKAAAARGGPVPVAAETGTRGRPQAAGEPSGGGVGRCFLTGATHGRAEVPADRKEAPARGYDASPVTVSLDRNA